MNDAMKLLKSKQSSDGCWKLENTYNGKFIVDIEKKGERIKMAYFKGVMCVE